MPKTRRPIRRKPDRPKQQDDYTTYSIWEEYMPPWAVTLSGAMIGLLAVLLPMMLGVGRAQGWW